jgi:prepilin-type processing-associated H-X9-DG protein
VAAVTAEAGPKAVPSTLRRPAPADGPAFSVRRRADVIVAAGIGFLAFGLLLGAVQKSRHEASVRACQNTLRELYGPLDGYSQTHSGRYPQVGVPGAPTAGGFAAKLTEAGYLSPDALVRCPALDTVELGRLPGGVGYTYALGYVTPAGGLIGLRRPDPILGTHDRMALGGDFPTMAVAPAEGPYSPHGRGHNILFAGGNVTFCTSADVGIDGDDIYRNADGRIAAGRYASDGCLGKPTDRP